MTSTLKGVTDRKINPSYYHLDEVINDVGQRKKVKNNPFKGLRDFLSHVTLLEILWTVHQSQRKKKNYDLSPLCTRPNNILI